MDEDKNDIDKMNEIMKGCESIQKLDPSKFIEIYEIYNKELIWFIAISAGTLLFILSNFDKFILEDGSMPNKLLYMESIVSVGFSTIFLVILKGKFFWHQNKIIRTMFGINNSIEDMQGISRDIAHSQSLDSIQPDILPRLFNVLKGTKRQQNSLYNLNFELADVNFSKGNVNFVVMSYLIGTASFSIYIIIFMLYYV